MKKSSFNKEVLSWALYDFANSRYVFRILALKEICQNPKKYGFKIEEQDYYQHAPTFEVFVDTTRTSSNKISFFSYCDTSKV